MLSIDLALLVGVMIGFIVEVIIETIISTKNYKVLFYVVDN